MGCLQLIIEYNFSNSKIDSGLNGTMTNILLNTIVNSFRSNILTIAVLVQFCVKTYCGHYLEILSNLSLCVFEAYNY